MTAKPYKPEPPEFPPTPLTAAQESFLSKVQPVCDEQDMFLSSFFRTPDRNRIVGGVPSSLHLQGLAVDVDKFGADLDEYQRIAALFNERGLGVLIYYDQERSYMHVQEGPLLSGSFLSVVT